MCLSLATQKHWHPDCRYQAVITAQHVTVSFVLDVWFWGFDSWRTETRYSCGTDWEDTFPPWWQLVVFLLCWKKKKSHCQLEYIHTSRLLPQQPMQIVTACLKKSWLTWSHTNNLESHSYTSGISLIIISWNHSWALTTHTGVINTFLQCNNKQSITEILH